MYSHFDSNNWQMDSNGSLFCFSVLSDDFHPPSAYQTEITNLSFVIFQVA